MTAEQFITASVIFLFLFSFFLITTGIIAYRTTKDDCDVKIMIEKAEKPHVNKPKRSLIADFLNFIKGTKN